MKCASGDTRVACATSVISRKSQSSTMHMPQQLNRLKFTHAEPDMVQKTV